MQDPRPFILSTSSQQVAVAIKTHHQNDASDLEDGQRRAIAATALSDMAASATAKEKTHFIIISMRRKLLSWTRYDVKLGTVSLTKSGIDIN